MITDTLGIHARPAGELVRQVSNFQSAVKLSANGRTVDAKGILGIMSLGVKQGHEITVTAEGTDEDIAIRELEVFMKERL